MRRSRMTMALLMALTLGIGAVGCSSENGNGNGGTSKPSEASTGSAEPASQAPANEEPLKFVFQSLTVDIPKPDNDIYRWLKENKNVDIDFRSVNSGDQIVEKMNLMLAGGDVPDVMEIENYAGAIEVAKKMGEAGLVIPLDDWLAKYPDLIKQNDKEYDDAIHRSKKDGKMYMIPTNLASKQVVSNVGPVIREDWLKKVGMEAPKTTDELVQVLKAFQEQIPDVDGKAIIPASFDANRQAIANAWTRNWVDFAADNSSLLFQFNNPAVEGYLVFMQKLQAAKLLDREMFTQQQDQFKEKLSSGRVGYTVAVYWDMDTVNAALKGKDPNARFIPAPPLKDSQTGIEPIYTRPSNRPYTSILISSKFAKNERNLERLMEFLNWTASDEGTKLLNYGPDNAFYELNQDNLLELKPEFKDEKTTDNSGFVSRTGLGVYNILRTTLIPSIEVNSRTPEAQMGTIWDEAIGPALPLAFELATPGPVETAKWGDMWAEFDKWSFKAISAKSEEETRKITQQMLEFYDKNGGTDIANERLASMKAFESK